MDSQLPGLPWLKLLHIGAVIVWCGALLYLPAAIAAERRPAALLAVAAGTAIFLRHGPIVPWLLAKLAVVGLLVLGHAGCGLLILARERTPAAALAGRCFAVGLSSIAWLLTICWLVLAKPALAESF